MSEIHRDRLKELLLKTLLAESEKRRSRGDWIEQERQAMFRVSCDYADRHGLFPPTIEEVKRAENTAYGHIDYAAKFALRLADSVISKTNIAIGDLP